MEGWRCDSCGAQDEGKVTSCPVCGRKEISEANIEKTEDDYSYDDVMKKLEEYDEGTEQLKSWRYYFWD